MPCIPDKPSRDPGRISSHSRLWAKTDPDGRWHPLILHGLDVAAVASALLQREPATTRSRLAALLGLPWHLASPWLLLIIAAHDAGKAAFPTCVGMNRKPPVTRRERFLRYG